MPAPFAWHSVMLKLSIWGSELSLSPYVGDDQWDYNEDSKHTSNIHA